jgi:hypothetical protein
LPSVSPHIRFEIVPQAFHRNKLVCVFPAHDVPMVSLARLVVVANKTLSVATEIETVFQTVRPIGRLENYVAPTSSDTQLSVQV